MKIKYYFLLFLSQVCFNLLAQDGDLKDDFEGSASITSWFDDDCNLSHPFANPYKQGINTSNNVLSYHDVGGKYANIGFNTGENLELDSHYVFSLKIYIPTSGLTGTQNNQISLKLQDGSKGSPWETQTEIVKNVVLDQWQTLTFDFKNGNYNNLNPGSVAPILRTDFNRILLQINGENNSDAVLAYIDDFSYEGKSNTDPQYTFLVWSDEFNSNGAIDASKWFHQTQLPSIGSWYNGEIQHYTNRLSNSFVSNGALNIVAKKESFTDQNKTKQYTSARLNSKFAFTYGKVEVRAKLPSGVGTWPAIWMLGKNINEDGAYWDQIGFGTKAWPSCGEIDIMEHWGTNQNFVQSAMHTPSSSGATVNHGGRVLPTASTAFHVYQMKWTPEKIIFSVDGIVHYTYEPQVRDASTWPFDEEQYFLFNIAIQPSITSNFVQSSMLVDYIRVYQDKPLISSVNSITKSNYNTFPNPFKDQLTIDASNTSAKSIDLVLYDNCGRIILQETKLIKNNKVQLNNLAHLPKGIYILSYNVEEQKYQNKVIKN